MGQKDNERNEKQALTCCRQDIGANGFPTSLHQHIRDCEHRYERVRNNLIVERSSTHGYHLWVVAEQRDSFLTKEKEKYSPKHEEHRTHLQTERIPFLDTLVQFCTKAEATQRLETLT